MLISIPAVVVGSRAEAVFHSQVPPQETATPSRAMPARNIAASRRPAAGQFAWPRRVIGRSAARGTTSGARPTTLDHEPAGVPGRAARNLALARAYQGHRATGATSAARPMDLAPSGAGTERCVSGDSTGL